MKTVVVYFSGYGHTKKIAEEVAKGAEASLVAISAEGLVEESDWALLDEADAIIMGSPTYMGNAAWQFKRFADDSSKRWFTGAWSGKVFGGFSISASLNGDKQVTLIFLQTFASQHGGIWVSLGLLPANSSTATRKDLNALGSSVGLLTQCDSDQPADSIPEGDLKTAVHYGQRVLSFAKKVRG